MLKLKHHPFEMQVSLYQLGKEVLSNILYYKFLSLSFQLSLKEINKKD